VNNVTIHLREQVVQQRWGYHQDGPQAAEPAAFACLALCASSLHSEALPLATWLAKLQLESGSVGVTADQPTPAWPTSLAMSAWRACDQATGSQAFANNQQLAMRWALQTKGKSAPRQPHVGHDTTIEGWSWAAATHSWLEPTCFFVLALKSMGQSNHPRTRAGVRLIIDRQLESGGCNFGNTQVLGQATLPHVQSTGLAMLAIADEKSADPRIAKSLDYLGTTINSKTATASLAFALLGLAAHGQRPPNAHNLIDHALRRELSRGPSCYKLALLTLASLQKSSWITQPPVLAAAGAPSL